VPKEMDINNLYKINVTVRKFGMYSTRMQRKYILYNQNEIMLNPDHFSK